MQQATKGCFFHKALHLRKIKGHQLMPDSERVKGGGRRFVQLQLRHRAWLLSLLLLRQRLQAATVSMTTTHSVPCGPQRSRWRKTHFPHSSRNKSGFGAEGARNSGGDNGFKEIMSHTQQRRLHHGVGLWTMNTNVGLRQRMFTC
jgi:hypothetical protein